MSWLRYLRSLFAESAQAVLPICLLLFVLKAVFLMATAGSFADAVRGMGDSLLLVAGVLLIVFGLSFFLQGLDHSLLPLGRDLGSTLPRTARLWLIIVFSLALGALAAVAEPDLKVYVDKTLPLLGGGVGRTVLMAAVALGSAAGLALGILRIALRLRFIYVLLPLIASAGILTLVCPKPLNLASWDIAPVISGAVTVPLFLALGIGLGAVMSSDNPGTSGFGLITLASLGPVIAVLILGAVSAGGPREMAVQPGVSLGENARPATLAQTEGGVASGEQPGQGSIPQAVELPTGQNEGRGRPFFSAARLLETAWQILRIILPVYLFLILFQRLVMRNPVRHLRAVFVGVGVLIVGLVLFIEGLEAGFFPLTQGVGRSMPRVVPWAWADIGLCLILGLAVTFAEPAVLVFAKQVEKATAGALSRRFLYVILGVGVAFGFGLGIAVIWFGLPLAAILLFVLAVEVVFSFFAAERYALLAWDAMGVASGTITVPFFMAMGMGLAASSPRGAEAAAGLGLVIMASAGPVLSMLIVGIVAGRAARSPSRRPRQGG